MNRFDVYLTPGKGGIGYVLDVQAELLQSLIPTPADQNPCAQSRMPIDMMGHGRAASLFHASEQ